MEHRSEENRMHEHEIIEKATILIVDDSPGSLSLMNCLLEGDYIVRVASGGEKALKIAASDSPPDLILLDVMMPGMDGYEVCRQLKCDPRTRSIPVIFFSGGSGMEDRKKGLELGAVGYITKLIEPVIAVAFIQQQMALQATARSAPCQNG
jgi:putative two-component system response regulator